MSLISNLTGTADLSTPADNFRIGGTPGMQTLRQAFTVGTGNGQCNQHFHDQRSILTTANDDLDLAGGLTNALGATITFAKIKLLIVTIVSPDGTKSLRLGPQGVANGWQGPWSAVDADSYTTTLQTFIDLNQYGYTVTGGSADVLRIHNPGAGTVAYQIYIAGNS